MLPMMGFMRVVLESGDFSAAARRGPGSAAGSAARGRRGALAHRDDALHEALGVVEEAVFVGDDAQTRGEAAEVHRGASRKSGRDGLPTVSLPAAKVS